MNLKPDGGTPSPFAARVRVQSRPQETPAPVVSTPAPAAAKSSREKAPLWPWILCAALAAAGSAAWFMAGDEEVAPAAEANAARNVVEETRVAEPRREAKADFEILAARVSSLDLAAADRALVASALLKAKGGAHDEAVGVLGPLVSGGVEAVFAEAARDLLDIRLEDHATPAAQRLRLEGAMADQARQKKVWAEAVARRDAALAVLPEARAEIAANLDGLAAAAAKGGDAGLATFFYAQALRLNPENADARAHLYRHKFAAGQQLRNRTGMTLVYAPPGEFLRGSPAGEPGRASDETPARVRLSKGFFIGVTEVSQREWDAVFGPGSAARVIGASPAKSRAIGPDLPMHSIRFDEAAEFCRLLSEREGVTYRPPTEAEWEYACRAGTTTAFNTGTNFLSAREANIDDGSAAARFAAAAVGVSGPANAWGLRDMHGNVWEWCSDWSGPYAAGDQVDPAGLSDAEIGRVDLAMRVVRGGGWNTSASDARSANRWEFSPVAVTAYIGLRVVAEPDLLAP
jgi:formylglycine-generating enzyme required for sulfatase activity